MSKEVFARPLIIAGPCALESEDLARQTLAEAGKRGIERVRMTPWKPRTRPGFAGIGDEALPLITLASKEGFIPSAEAMTGVQAEKLVRAVDGNRLIIWIGARNYNQNDQEAIGRAVAGVPQAMLMVKNPMWYSQDAWEGAIEWAVKGGADPKQLLLCHRGFAPGPGQDNQGLRNIPDFKMAMVMRKKTGFPTIFDPSHCGGSVPKVFELAEKAAAYQSKDGLGFDGLMVEVHPNPTQALTDQKQQLTWPEYDRLLEIIHRVGRSEKLPASNGNGVGRVPDLSGLVIPQPTPEILRTV